MTTEGTDGTMPTRRFFVHCPHCGDESSVTLDLNDLDEIFCVECGWTGTPAMAAKTSRENADTWERVARWIAAAKWIAAADDVF